MYTLVSRHGFRAGLVVAAALLALWTLAHVQCTTTETAPVMLAMARLGTGRAPCASLAPRVCPGPGLLRNNSESEGEKRS